MQKLIFLKKTDTMTQYEKIKAGSVKENIQTKTAE